MTAKKDGVGPAEKIGALLKLGDASSAERPNEGDIRIADFEEQHVRAHIHNDVWWLSVVDVISVLAVSDRPSKYWTDLKARLIDKEGFSEISAKIGNLKLPTADGKMRRTEAVTVETLLRVLQSVPSPKVEGLKQWLARVGFERLEEIDDPSKALERLIGIYLNQGRTPEWIRERIDGIMTRRELTDEWRDRGITSDNHYSTLTRMLQKRSIGMGPAEHKRHKGLKPHHSLRDHSNEVELLLTRLGEKSTIEIARARDAKGYEQNRDAVEAGGEIAKTARLKLEELTKAPIASKSNFLPKTGKTPSLT